jgi:hypothetical protein
VRIHTETRGLVLKDANNRDMPATDWHWRTLAIDDRVLAAPRSNRIAVDKAKGRTRTPEDEPFEKARFDVIKDCRRNYPAIKVLPSFEPDQGYEAWVWIEAQDDKPGRDYPVRVEYSAGPYFQEIAVVEAATDPQFRTVFSYYGPTLIQARMYWSDGTHSVSYIFAHYPRQELEIG